MAKARILSVGALTQDTILRVDALPSEQGKYIARDAIQIAAGMAASAACAAQRLGAAATLWASAGDDVVGDQLIAGISAEGVDCRYVRRVPGAASAVSAILVDPQGERIIVPYYDPRTHAAPDALPFNIGGFDTVLVDTRWPGAAERTLKAAKAAGLPAILDADTAPREVLERLLPHATFIVASEPAAAILCDGAEPAEACRILAERTGFFVAITAGGRGTYWRLPGASSERHTPAPTITAVDTLSAGDVYHGAFALAVAEGMEMETAIRFASAAAAVKCLRFGGRLAAPDRDETLAMMQAHYSAG